MLQFKFHQNHTINELFDFSRFKGSEKKGEIQKFGKVSYRAVFSTHTENFNILAQLESVENSEELIRFLGGLKPLPPSLGR